MDGSRRKIVILGAGNVASHIAPALAQVADVVQVWSRNYGHAAGLAQSLPSVTPVSKFDDIVPDADLYLISVPDEAITKVAAGISGVKGIVAHTSGSYSLQELKEQVANSRVGVFYPLQTFSKNSKLDISQVPMLIEGENQETTAELTMLASLISKNVRQADSELRRNLHIAAVFACNFANFMWDIADTYLRENTELDMSILYPLLDETLAKIKKIRPCEGQTGPAIRNDQRTIKAHTAKLDADKAEIYQFISQKIYEKHNRTHE